ncbi:MAG: hypothetical protein U0791_11810 [Gemmataceae bacterium]
MSVSKLLAAGVLLCTFGAFSLAEDDKVDYAKLVVGKWEVTKAAPGTVPAGTLVEFAKDGKLKVVAKKGDNDFSIDGTYTLEKSTLTMKMKIGDDEKTKAITITKISDKSMSTKDSDDKVVEMERKK